MYLPIEEDKNVKTIRKLSALLIFCAALLIGFGGTVHAEEAAGMKTVYITASTKSEMIIEPTAVTGREDQTVKELLAESGHEFAGLEDGWIVSIDGVTGNYRRFFDGNAYQLDTKLKDVTVLCFTEAEDAYSENMLELIRYLGQYRAKEDYEKLQKYEPAKQAYDNALKGLCRGAGSEDAEALRAALVQAVNDYEAILNGPKYTVIFAATKGSQTVTGLKITMTDAYGNETKADGTTIQVPAGTYHFSVSDGTWNRTEGNVEIVSEKNLTVALPDGEWFGDIKLLDKNKNPYAGEQDKSAHKAVYQIPDTISSSGIYLNAASGALLDDATTRLRTIYTGTDGKDKSETARTWNSEYTALAFCLQKGMGGRTFQLEAQYTVTDENRADFGYVMIQSYEMELQRYPTLKNIFVKAGNTELMTGFQNLTMAYELCTTSDRVVISGTPLEEGCTVLVDQNASGIVELPEKKTYEIPVSVSYGEGNPTVYTLRITRTDAAKVTLKVPADTEVQVTNQALSEIKAEDDGTYLLIPGEQYTYTATKGSWYHSTASFLASEGKTVHVAAPETKDAMTAFALYDNGGAAKRKEFTLNSKYQKSTHQYECVVPDMNTAVYAQATGETGYQINARYQKQTTISSTNDVFYETQIKKPYSSTGACTILGSLVAKSGYGQNLSLRLSKTSDTDASVTLYQDYEVKIKRSLHIINFAASLGGTSLDLTDQKGNIISFNRNVDEYWVTVERGSKAIWFQAEFPNTLDTTDCCGGYYALMDGERYDSLENIEFALGDDPDRWDEKNVAIEIHNIAAGSVPMTYTIHIRQMDPVSVTFKTEPENARILVKNNGNKKTVLPENGVYRLIPGTSYTYRITASGYRAKEVSNYKASSQAETVNVQLEKASENTSLVKFDAEWPTFRYDEENNGVVENIPVPRTAEEAVLYWSTALGEGYDSDACGSPILIGDYIYTYAKNQIYKVNKMTGEVEASGTMDHASSFAINPPTYADGMIFVGLANGCIQAFNADTLEPLWIYHDELGGQPNCPIIYKNGYIYTGFWRSEVERANFVCLSVTDEDPSSTKEEKKASWAYTQKGGFYWAGAYASNDFVLIGTDDGEASYTTGHASLLSLDPKTGAVISQITLPHTGDIRCNIVRQEGTNSYYFTSKGGYFYGVTVDENGIIDENSLKYIQLKNGSEEISMSTSTPTIYGNRAYIGVCGASQFGAYSGHNITVLDLKNWGIAYQVKTMGYPQTSGLLTTAYEKSEGVAYIYFFDNYTPGKLRVITDKEDQTAPGKTITESYRVNGKLVDYETAPVLFTPDGEEAQYAICSPIVDKDGTIYFKNDSGRLMALGSTIDHLEIAEPPTKTAYAVGDLFEPAGIKVIAHYTNGTSRDITDLISYSDQPLTAEDTEFEIRFEHVKYQDKDGVAGVDYTAPSAEVELTIAGAEQLTGDVNGDSVVNEDDAKLVVQIANGEIEASEEQLKAADVDGDGEVDAMDAELIYGYCKGRLKEFPADTPDGKAN